MPASTPEGATIAGGSLKRFRSEFPVLPQAVEWDVVTGTGMSMLAGQTSQGSVLAVTTGTTVNSSTSLTSTAIFSAPFKVAASILLSQKIVNQQVYFEAVACDPVTGVTDESRVLAWRISGDDNTTVTNASYDAQSGGASRVRVLNQATPTIAGAIGGVAPTTTLEIEHLVDEAWFHCRNSDSVNARVNTYARTTTLPDGDLFYKARVRIVNGSTAPASTTTVWVGHVTADSHTEQPVEIVNSRGSVGAAQALPVTVTGTANVTTSASSAMVLQASNSVGTVPTAVRFDALLAAAQTVKATANARLYWATIFNPNAAMAAVHFYNATAPTIGTTAPVLTVAVPAGGTVILPSSGLPYLSNATAMTVAATTTATTAGAVAPTTGLSVSVGFL